ncbi:hypothetical protein B7463_g3095, partial [Scytalidium lignicola]
MSLSEDSEHMRERIRRTLAELLFPNAVNNSLYELSQQPLSLQTDPNQLDTEHRVSTHREALSPLFIARPSSPPFASPGLGPTGSQLPAHESPLSRLAAAMSSRRGRSRTMANARNERLSRIAQYQRNLMNNSQDDTDRQEQNPTVASINDLTAQFAQSHSDLRALLEDPVFQFSASRERSEPEYMRGAKRRKLDSDRLDSEFAGFSYGRYGQVEPGKLNMEIVSCDGGIHKEARDGNYAAENVLKNDPSVYCTESNRCNLVLRHQGGTVFSLKELIIKAPLKGYTAPIQEGMVFIAMESDELLESTAKYQIQYSQPRSNTETSETPIVSIRHNEDGSMTTAQARARRLYNIGLHDADCDLGTAQIPPEFAVNAPLFQITTECSDSEDDSEGEGYDEHSRDSPDLSRPSLYSYSGISFDDPTDDDQDEAEYRLRRQLNQSWPGLHPHRPRRRTVRTQPTSPPPAAEPRATLAEVAEANQGSSQEAGNAEGKKLMVPHARFFIERDKSKCTVRFDPPVSGRFVLLKMWSPRPTEKGNIDIQSVVLKGFAGPRFFPAITMR